MILYVREDISSKLINSSCIDHDKEYFIVELNFRKKVADMCNYNLYKTMMNGYLQYINKVMNSHSSKYDNFLLISDFNSEPTEEANEKFLANYNFKNLLDKPVCYKKPTNPSCVDLIVTNKPGSFQNFCTFESGLSGFNKMTLTVLKLSFGKQKPRVLNYHNCKFFNNTPLFRDQIPNKLRNSNLQIGNKDLKHFKETCLSFLNTNASLKSRFI